MLLAARLARLGFLANFLSRTVLVGFLTGVGIQVAAGQLPDMLGVSAAGEQTPCPGFVDTRARAPACSLGPTWPCRPGSSWSCWRPAGSPAGSRGR